MADERRPDGPPYQPSLDGLRALAGLAIFGVHFDQVALPEVEAGPFRLSQFLENGRLGVAMFLLLSGYCLAWPLWSLPADKRLTLITSDFLLRRFARIVPVYWCILGSMWIVHLVRGGNLSWEWLAHAAFLQNCWSQSLYAISEPFWAIALICQYYIFWCLLLFVLRRTGFDSDRSLLLVLVGFMGVAWCVGAALETSGVAVSVFGDAVWRHGLLIHLPIFLLGAILSRTAQQVEVSNPRVSLELSAIGGVVTLLFAMAYQPIHLDIPASRYAFPLVPLLFGLLIYLANRGRVLKQLLSTRWLVFGGTISYAFYLVHFPAIRLTKRLLIELGHSSTLPILATVSFTVACLVACALTWMIEKPIRRLLVGRWGRTHGS